MDATTTKPVRYGIIGTGMIGREHIRNLLLLPTATIVAVADTCAKSLEAAKGILEKPAPDCTYYTQYEALAKDDKVDAVVICTPNFHHYEVLFVVIDAKKHILCEKPLCVSLKQCAEIERHARKSGVYVLSSADLPLTAEKKLFYTAMEYRFYPSINRLVQEVEKGTVGKLRMFSIQEHRFPFLGKVGNWNRFALNSGGTLVEKACHFFDLMRRVTGGEPVLIFASGSQDLNHLNERYPATTYIAKDSGAEQIFDRNTFNDHNELIPDILDNAFVTVDFDNGVRAMLDLCMFAEASKHQEHLCATGTKGKVEAFAPSHGAKDKEQARSFVRIGRRTEWATRDSAPDLSTFNPIEEIDVDIDEKLLKAGDHGGATYYEHEAFVKAIGTEDIGRSFVTFKDGVLAVLMGVAASRSIKEKRAVPFAEVEEELNKLLEEER